jgi:hypothetical protein
MQETLRNLFVAVLFIGSLSIFGVAMPRTDAALVAIAHPTVDVSSMAGLPAQLITNALLGLDHAARAQPVWPGDSGPVSTKSQRTARQTLFHRIRSACG